MDQSKHLVIIGAGPAGYTAAFLAADQGLRITLIDKDPFLGGTCLHNGCIPSKALLHIAKIISNSKQAETLGLTFADPQIDVEKIQAFKDQVVSKLSAGLSHLCKQRKITLLQGMANFTDSKTLRIKDAKDEKQNITFDLCIIATGSHPAKPAFLQKESDAIIFSQQALSLKKIPKNFLIVGGGYIGLEMAEIYSSLGSQITVCEMEDSLLPGVDSDFVKVLERKLRKKIHQLKLKTKVKSIDASQAPLKVTFESKGQANEETFDQILVATGRTPNTDSLNLQNANIDTDEKGFIKTDDAFKTTNQNIYAIGDAIGNPMLAHKASYEAHLTIKNISGENIKPSLDTIPSVVYTNPEIAYCGLTELQARERNIDIKISKTPWISSGRALTLNEPQGLTKLIFDAKNGNLLGAGIVGVDAGELITQAVIAIKSKQSAQNLTEIIYPHPTLSETFKECIQSFLGENPHSLPPKKS